MRVVLIGKEHMQGISKKTGNPYSFNIAHIERNESGVEGKVGDKVFLDTDKFPLTDLLLGATYDLEYNSRGRVAQFELAE